jgi:NDP-sugar pyrophosphorylase family protein
MTTSSFLADDKYGYNRVMTASRKKNWFGQKELTCVVLCAGAGKRILSSSWEKPKALLEVKHKPILNYIIEYWDNYVSDFVFVVGFKREQVIAYVSTMPIKMRFVEQKELKGIADAIQCVRDLVADRFVVVLGDCICRGEFDTPDGMEQGIGIVKTDNPEDIRNGYSVEVRGDLVYKVEEKPEVVPNNLCGMGVYFFDEDVFKYIDVAEPSKLRNEVEITNVIQDMIDRGKRISPVFFQGDYLNINYAEDIHRAEGLL